MNSTNQFLNSLWTTSIQFELGYCHTLDIHEGLEKFISMTGQAYNPKMIFESKWDDYSYFSTYILLHNPFDLPDANALHDPYLISTKGMVFNFRITKKVIQSVSTIHRRAILKHYLGTQNRTKAGPK